MLQTKKKKRIKNFKKTLKVVKRSIKAIACEQAPHLGDIVKSTRASGTRDETWQQAFSRGSFCLPKWWDCSQANKNDYKLYIGRILKKLNPTTSV